MKAKDLVVGMAMLLSPLIAILVVALPLALLPGRVDDDNLGIVIIVGAAVVFIWYKLINYLEDLYHWWK